MILLTYQTEAGYKLAVKTDKGILDVENVFQKIGGEPNTPTSMETILAGGKRSLVLLNNLIDAASTTKGSYSWFLEESSLDLGPCQPTPKKVICVGLNYRKHAIESNMDIPKTPVLFSKFQNTITGTGKEIPLPADGEQYDYEAELAIVIGKQAKNISVESALDYVLGYCCANDFSCRDLQFRTGQWLLGKSYDGWCPIGPYLVTADEVSKPNNLNIRCYVNKEKRQDSNTSDMIFNCEEIISYVSSYITLEPGDVILTGTPEGVALGLPNQPWLKPGDLIEIEIDGLGVLSNIVGMRRK
jgi:2-keto-4-pentenoate hydratase/2-oxohepta-3-ene-1,7-dioic acid hydratase in catechol pathway